MKSVGTSIAIIIGISSGQTGTHAANVIPPIATADIDLRLVVGVDWRHLGWASRISWVGSVSTRK